MRSIDPIPSGKVLHDQTSLRSLSMRGGAFTMAAEGVDFVLRLGSAIVLARLLVPEHFGLIGMVTAITAVIDRFKDLGLSTATVQRKEISLQQLNSLFWINAGFGLAIMLVVCALAYPVSRFYGDSRLVWITLAVATGFLWNGLTIQHNALLRRNMRFFEIAAIQIGSSAMSIVVAIVMALKGYGYWALVAREVSRSAFLAAGTFICLPWIPKRFAMEPGVGAMLSFGGDLTVVNLVFFLSSSLDQIVIGRTLGAVPLGLYRQGSSLVLAPIVQLTYAATVVAEAALSRLQLDPERYRRYYLKLVGVVSVPTMPLLVWLAVYAEEVVVLVLGEKWRAASSIFRIMAIAAFIRPAATTAAPVMISCGHSRRFLWLGLLSSVALIVFIFAGLPFGTNGIAAAQALSLYVLLIPKLYWSFKETPVSIRLFMSGIGRSLTASGATVAALILLRRGALVGGSLGSLGLGALVTAVVYSGVWLVTAKGRAEAGGFLADIFEALNLRPRRVIGSLS